MAVADAAATTGTRTVALSLKLAPTDVASLLRSAAAINSSKIALETQVDVVDATVTSAGTPTCADGQCLRVQMMFAPDTRVNPVDEPEVQLLDDGDAISNRVKVVVKIDADDLGTKPTDAGHGARARGRDAERPVAAAAGRGRRPVHAHDPDDGHGHRGAAGRRRDGGDPAGPAGPGPGAARGRRHAARAGDARARARAARHAGPGDGDLRRARPGGAGRDARDDARRGPEGLRVATS